MARNSHDRKAGTRAGRSRPRDWGLGPAILASLLAGSVAGLLVWSSIGSAQASPGLEVPRGRLGDEVTYLRFGPGGADEPWTLAPSLRFTVNGTEVVPDSSASSRRVLRVDWHPPPALYDGWSAGIDLESRHILRIEQSRLTRPEAEFSQYQRQVLTDVEFGPRLRQPWIANPDASLLWFQGLRIGPGAPIEAWLRHAADLLWLSESGTIIHSLDVRLGPIGSIESHPAREVSFLADATFLPEPATRFWRIADFSASGPGPGPKPLLSFDAMEPGRIGFERRFLLSAASAYPLQVHDRVWHAGGSYESVLELAEVRQGTNPIPWSGAPAVPTPMAATSGLDQQVTPRDGVGPGLCLPLSDAIRRADEDLTAVSFQHWKTQNPQRFVVGASLHCFDGTYDWDIVFAAPSGSAFVVGASDQGPTNVNWPNHLVTRGVESFPARVPPFRPLSCLDPRTRLVTQYGFGSERNPPASAASSIGFRGG